MKNNIETIYTCLYYLNREWRGKTQVIAKIIEIDQKMQELEALIKTA